MAAADELGGAWEPFTPKKSGNKLAVVKHEYDNTKNEMLQNGELLINIRDAHSEKLEEIDRMKEGILKSVEQHHHILTEKVNEVYEQCIEALQERQSLLTRAQKQMNETMTRLSLEDKASQRVGSGRLLDQKTWEVFENLQEELRDWELMMPSVKILEGQDWDSSVSTRLEVEEKPFSPKNNQTSKRPVVILSELRDKLYDDLIGDFPDKFGNSIPHTTRPQRRGEVDGQDYHYVRPGTPRQQLEEDIKNDKFIEAGNFNGQIYGTSVAAISAVAQQGKHCLLEVGEKTVKRMHRMGLSTIVIYIKLPSAKVLQKLVDQDMTDAEAWDKQNKAIKLESDFGDYFTAVLVGKTYSELYSKVKDVILGNR